MKIEYTKTLRDVVKFDDDKPQLDHRHCRDFPTFDFIQLGLHSIHRN